MIFGGFFVLLGFVGAVLPIMPTVPFLIVAAFCFGRSSEKMHVWLMTHRIFGPPLRNWETNRAIRRQTKWIALLSMAVGFAFVTAFVGLPIWALAIQGTILTIVSIFIWTRPEPKT
ncbi:hypothetical protein CDV52_14175 [Haematobacter missouriensis]|uniref:DUF454 domain-containing protein n=1 Tax=Haematobacter missouriensis TaxID=366616 RepID=A0A212AMA9_9RHOB|nr:hypothetical protein CDV53_16290 [Haematobacter missouriensis]OWJ82609.1 hypothetical protein CDV52_14175 [Haematobacter missouriensis]